MILPLVNFVKDMRIVLSEVDIFRIFVNYLRNEKKHMCNSSSRKKYDHLESEFNIVTMQRIEPNSYGYRIKYINVLRRDIFTLERSMFRNFYFRDFYFRDFDYIDILKRSGSFGNIKKGLSAEYAASTCVPDRYFFHAHLLSFIIPNTVLRLFICKQGLSAE